MTYARGRILWTTFAAIAIIIGTYLAIAFAQGYRPSRDNIVSGNGLLVANSEPKGARVFVDERFISATDDTLYLDPGEYNVEIKKDGYFPWQKKVVVEKEVVTQANALLFPTAPSLTPLTFSGSTKTTPSPDGQKIAYYTASSSAQTKNGFYIAELADNPLAFQRGPKQITQPSTLFPPEKTEILWSPDSTQLLLISPQKTVLIEPSRLNTVEELPDITFQLPSIFSQWEEEMYQRDRERLAKFPSEIQEIATQSAVNVYFSPDEDRLMYTATSEAILADQILPPKPGSNTQEQQRKTQVGGIYIYDREEDRQFRIGTDEQYVSWLTNLEKSQEDNTDSTAMESDPLTIDGLKETANYNPQKQLLANDLYRSQPLTLEASPSAFTRLQDDNINHTLLNFRTYHSPLFAHHYQWFPNSYHVLYHDESGIIIQEYDGTNSVKVYSGPFSKDFVYPWPNGSRLIIRTNFNQGENVPMNLYTVDLR